MTKIDKILTHLKEVYGLDADLSSATYEELSVMLATIQAKKHRVILESTFNSYANNPNYTELLLLESVIRMILREIAPKRLSRRKKKGN